jgi:hypothetical protein
MPARMSAMNVATGVATLLATSVVLVATIGIACAGPVDETALREYARQKRTDRVEMETRRLERLHPDWKPQADLWSARPSGPDEAPLWDLYEAGELDLLRQAIAQRREQQRDWNPSDDLVEKIKALELRTQILDRAASGKWTEAAQLASDNGLAAAPGISSCCGSSPRRSRAPSGQRKPPPSINSCWRAAPTPPSGPRRF